MPENNDKSDNPNGNHKDYRKAVEERVRKEAEILEAAKIKKKFAGVDPYDSEGKITSKFRLECLYANELGDGMLYAAIHKKKFLYDKSSDEMFIWAGHHWEDDVMKKSISAVEDVALQYLAEAKKTAGDINTASENGDKAKVKTLQKTQDHLYKRVFRLRKSAGRKACIEFAHTNPVNPIDIDGDKFNTDHYSLGCKNGVIDLRTGELRPGRQNDYINKASPIEYPGINAQSKIWDTFLNEIFDGNELMISYICRMFGYMLTGLTVERFMPILYGADGNNGKTTLVETASYYMGPLASPIEAEMLLDQGRVKSAGSASPEIMSLRGLRLAHASETDQGRRFSISRVKWLIGSDSMFGRFLYEKRPIPFIPTHKLILLTNHKPDVSGDDNAFWEKIHLIPFPFSFVLREPVEDYERPADKHLRQKLLKDAPAILAWAVRGCLQWQEQGLNPPPAVIDASKEYRRDEDLIQHFIDDCCYKAKGVETTAKDLYDCFKKWWETNVTRKALSQKRFGGMMVKKFQRSKSGTYRYFGIGVNDEDD